MKKLDFLKIVFLLRKERTQEGLAPIYMVLRLDSRRAYLSTRYGVEPENWDVRNGRFIPNSSKANSMNELLDRMRLDSIKIYNELRSKHDDVTIDELRRKLLGEDAVKPKNLVEVCNLYNSNAEKLINIEFGKITYGRYLHFAKTIGEFIFHKFKMKDIPIGNVKYSFGIEYEFFLKTEKKLHQNTLIKFMQYLNRIMDFAVQYEWIDKNILSNYKCSTIESNKQFLTESELKAIEEKEIDIERLREIRDVFIFCCYTGYAYIDASSLTKDNIVTGINGMKWIYTSRQKTKHTSNVPLLEKALNIIERYESHPECIRKGKLLPIKSNQRTNTYLQELADICGIKKHLTTHIARHTFATTVLLSNGVSMEATSKMLGHSSLKTTQIYGKILETRVGSEMEMLKAKLSAGKKSDQKREAK